MASKELEVLEDYIVQNKLKITKQSLARVLKQLVDAGYIEQKPGPEDRRQRELYLTGKGQLLIRDLREPQSRRIVAALERSGCAEEDIARFLLAMVTENANEQIAILNAAQRKSRSGAKPAAGKPDAAQ